MWLIFVPQLTAKQMTTTEQQNTYTITNANGSNSDILIVSPNLKEAVKIAKAKYPNQCYFGKVKRIYNGGANG